MCTKSYFQYKSNFKRGITIYTYIWKRIRRMVGQIASKIFTNLHQQSHSRKRKYYKNYNRKNKICLSKEKLQKIKKDI